MTDTGPAVEKQIHALADGRGLPRWVRVRLFDDMKLRMATGAILTLGMPKADDLPLAPAESRSLHRAGRRVVLPRRTQGTARVGVRAREGVGYASRYEH